MTECSQHVATIIGKCGIHLRLRDLPFIQNCVNPFPDVIAGMRRRHAAHSESDTVSAAVFPGVEVSGDTKVGQRHSLFDQVSVQILTFLASSKYNPNLAFVDSFSNS